MNLRFMKRTLAYSVNSPSVDGGRIVLSNSWVFDKNGRAESRSEVINSNPSVVRKINSISGCLFKVMTLLAVVLNGSMSLNASSSIEDHCVEFSAMDCEEIGIQSQMGSNLTSSNVGGREFENPLMSLLEDRNTIEVITEWCYIVSKYFDGDTVQLDIYCDREICGNKDIRKFENIELSSLINRVWNMIIIGLDKEIRDGILDYLTSGNCIQFNVEIGEFVNFEDEHLTWAWRNRNENFAFKVFPDKHVERVEFIEYPTYEILPLDDDDVKESVRTCIVSE